MGWLASPYKRMSVPQAISNLLEEQGMVILLEIDSRPQAWSNTLVQGREAMFRGRLLRCWQEEQQRSVLSFSMMVEQPNLYPLQCFGLILTLDTASSVLDKGRLSCAMCLNLRF